MSALQRAFYRGLTPPPKLTVSQWADEFRMLSPESSAEPGRWRTSRAPFQRAIMDAVNDPDVDTVVVMSSSQIGKTELLLNMLGFMIDLDPGPVLVIQPTLEMAEAFSKDRLDPMLRDTPVLRNKIRHARKDASNTIRHKSYPGGQITLAGSNSAAGLASRPIRVVLSDEVDRWEASVGEEGDPLALAEKRTTTFWNAKHIVVSTPTVKGASRIEAKFEEGDQRYFFVACPHCTTRHVLKWANVKWLNNNPETAHLVCPECGCEIDEAGRQQMLLDPEDRPTADFHRTRSFHVWEAYSPWRRLADIVADFLEMKKAPDTLQVFINTSLGETWEQQGEQADTSALVARREPFPAAVPMGACCLTAGVDVQDDRLELLVIGWGPGEESWVIAHHVVPGDPQRPEPWKALDEHLTETYIHETGTQLQIAAACVDTAGHRSQFAYEFCSTRQHRRIYAIIGRDGSDRPIVSAPAQKRSGKDPRKVPLFTIGVDICKALVHSRLKITERGPGYVHLPLPHQVKVGEFREGVDEEFIAQLTAEKLVTKHKAGVPRQVWVKTRPRNEAGDLMNYGIGALRLLRPDLHAMAARLNPNAPKKPAPETPGPAKKWIPNRKPGGWLKGRR